MGRVRTGTVGYSYRDWTGIFYPQGAHSRRQLAIYTQQFDVCELTQFSHQMPDRERVAHFVTQVRGDLSFFVRIHNAFTHCADIGLALSLARHFRKAMEPLLDAGKLSGLVATLPYAFKNGVDTREYLMQLAQALRLGELPLQLDFRHPSWTTESAFRWMKSSSLGFVCVDEPQIQGLLAPKAIATADRVLIRLHGRNAEGWWSGNAATRYDYLYTAEELQELSARYAPLLGPNTEVSFVFNNYWQAQSVRNAIQWKQLMSGLTRGQLSESIDSAPELPPLQADAGLGGDEDSSRPPTSLPLAEVKSRVSRALLDVQQALDLPAREEL